MVVDFEKKYNTYKEVDEMLATAKQGKTNEYKTPNMNDDDLQTRHYFAKEHQGHFYEYLKRRKHIVIPKILMKEGMLCGIADLALDKRLSNESVLVCRKNYAKQALMMFYPRRTIGDLRLNCSFWSKFVQVGGLMPYSPNVNVMDNYFLRKSKYFWERARTFYTIHIQVRQTMEHDMSLPPDPIQLQTTKSKSTGERTKINTDKDYMEDKCDIEISAFDADLGEFREAEEHFIEAIPREQLRDSNAIIKIATCF